MRIEGIAEDVVAEVTRVLPDARYSFHKNGGYKGQSKVKIRSFGNKLELVVCDNEYGKGTVAINGTVDTLAQQELRSRLERRGIQCAS
jgi:hypothetical protein